MHTYIIVYLYIPDVYKHIHTRMQVQIKNEETKKDEAAVSFACEHNCCMYVCMCEVRLCLCVNTTVVCICVCVCVCVKCDCVCV